MKTGVLEMQMAKLSSLQLGLIFGTREAAQRWKLDVNPETRP